VPELFEFVERSLGEHDEAAAGTHELLLEVGREARRERSPRGLVTCRFGIDPHRLKQGLPELDREYLRCVRGVWFPVGSVATEILGEGRWHAVKISARLRPPLQGPVDRGETLGLVGESGSGSRGFYVTVPLARLTGADGSRFA
jgi:hypothetical protein